LIWERIWLNDFKADSWQSNLNFFNRKHKRKKPHPTIPRSTCPFPESDYAQTFKAVEYPRPRSSKRPPPTPGVRDRHSAPMIFSTNQRDEFKSHGAVPRTKPIIPVTENYCCHSSMSLETFIHLHELSRLFLTTCLTSTVQLNEFASVFELL
jgi:hypothetical protein